MKKFFIIFLTLLSTVLYCQKTTWSSSHPTIVSVNANGISKLEKAQDVVRYVTITATTKQNGKITTNSKKVEVNPYYPGCNTASTYVAGLWWAGCLVGSSNPISYNGNEYSCANRNKCQTGWKVPSEAQWRTLVSNCTMKKVTKSGVNGFDMCGMFIPALGHDKALHRGEDIAIWDSNCGYIWFDWSSGVQFSSSGSGAYYVYCIKS